MLRIKALALVVAAIVMGCLVMLHTPGLNGPAFWPWPYRSLPPAPLYFLFALSSIPFFAGQLLDRRDSRRRLWALVLIMLSCFALKLASVAVHTSPPSLQFVRIIVENPDATSYYTDAAALSNFPARQWITAYPDLMRGLNLHSKTKPPGPILYWLGFIRTMGYDSATAMIGGLTLGALATLSIPATFLLLRRLTGDSDAAFCGASFLALCPGFVLFFPMFDPTYILLSAALIGFWFEALHRRSMLFAVALGLVLAATLVITFNVLVIGLYMIAMVFLVGDEPPARKLLGALRLAGIALGTAALVLLLLYLAIGHNPIETFISAWRNQHELLRQYAEHRQYPQTIPFDLVDFALGSGWISVLLVIYYLAGGDTVPKRQRLVIVGLAQLVAVAVLGLLQLETARVWNFMMPLLMMPVGLELARWTRPTRIATYAMLLLVAAAICQNVKLIY